MPKYLLTFEKRESVRWIGHLDILRTFERAIRRSRLPIAFSGGFNPRERLAFASALSVGVTGAAEPAMLELTAPVEPQEITASLNSVLPPGLRIADCSMLTDERARTVLQKYDLADYTVLCVAQRAVTADEVEAVIRDLLSADRLPVLRQREHRSNELDVRPFIRHLAACPPTERPDCVTLALTVAIGERGNAKPQEVVGLMVERGLALTARRVHRIRVYSSEG